MIGEEILIEIDATLDRLIRNAQALQTVCIQDLSEEEIEGFQKTQESLLHHLIHMDEFLQAKRSDLRRCDKRSASYKIQEKLLKFEHLKSSCQRSLSATRARKVELMSKRRGKKRLREKVGSGLWNS